jgi:hypothetical protein
VYDHDIDGYISCLEWTDDYSVIGIAEQREVHLTIEYITLVYISALDRHIDIHYSLFRLSNGQPNPNARSLQAKESLSDADRLSSSSTHIPHCNSILIYISHHGWSVILFNILSLLSLPFIIP